MADALKNADVEVKIMIPGEAAESACRLLGLEADDGKGLAIYFWDKPWTNGDDIRLPLSEAGVVIRLRKSEKGDADDLTVKLRPCVPDVLPADWRASRDGKDWEFKIEEDWAWPQPCLGGVTEGGRRLRPAHRRERGRGR